MCGIYIAGKDPGVMLPMMLSVMRRCVWDLYRREGPWSDVAHDVVCNEEVCGGFMSQGRTLE